MPPDNTVVSFFLRIQKILGFFIGGELLSFVHYLVYVAAIILLFGIPDYQNLCRHVCFAVKIIHSHRHRLIVFRVIEDLLLILTGFLSRDKEGIEIIGHILACPGDDRPEFSAAGTRFNISGRVIDDYVVRIEPVDNCIGRRFIFRQEEFGNVLDSPWVLTGICYRDTVSDAGNPVPVIPPGKNAVG